MNENVVIAELPDLIARAEDIPSPPTVATEVLMLTQRDDASFEDLAEVISNDPALASKILKLANSAAFSRGGEVSSLEVAGMRLGMKTLRLMALSFSLTETLPREGDEGDPFNYVGFWQYSMTHAVAGRALAQLVKSPRADEAFICGLLSRLGQVVMARCIADRYQAAVMKVHSRLPTAEVEREVLGFDHHDVGGALLLDWSLPAILGAAVLYAGDDRDLSALNPDTRHLVHLTRVAAHMAHVICGHDAYKGGALQQAHELASSYFGLDAHALDDCIIEMEDAVAETASLLSTRMEASEYTEIIEKARQQIVHLSVGTAIDLEQTTVRARELEDKYRKLADLAATDGLTGIANRAHFDEVLRETVAEKLTAESGRALGLLILDIDHFKQFNDTHGHPVGDRILTGVADCLRASVRSTDLAARYGGEEFVVILPQTTMVEVRAVADRLRRAIEKMTIVHEDDVLHVTASVGGACLQRVNGPDDGPALLALADACLYRAKDTGRNRCVCAEFSSIEDA